MRYKSTRGGVSGLSFEEAVMMGLASDGGLLIPEKIPLLNEKDLKHLFELPYTKLAYEMTLWILFKKAMQNMILLI